MHFLKKTIFAASMISAACLSPAALAQAGHDAAGHAHHGHGAAGKMDHGKMDHGRMASSPKAASAPYDLQFLDTMALHHQHAVDMALLVEQRSAQPELKALAKKMVQDQQREIRQMQQWKAKWYPGKANAVNLGMPGMKESMEDMSMDKLAASSGAAFDAMFIDMMGRHHAGAITMAQFAPKRTKRAEIRDFAGNIIAAQSEEMTQMKRWHKAWQATTK